MKLRGIWALLLAAPAAAQPVTPAEKAWNMLARADVEAALDLIVENHPGAAPELGDSEFQQALERGRANAERRLPLVKDFGGHAALMNGLAADFRDGHVMSNSPFSRTARNWAGLVIRRSGGKWLVGAQERADGEPQLDGAELASCDGVAADRMARELIGTFYTDPAVEAGMIANAPNLLLDHNNPFIARPKSCVFRKDGRIVEHALRWRQIGTQRLNEQYVAKAVPAAKAGMGLSSFAGGHWIALETLDNPAAKVVEAVRAQQEELRKSPLVVLDMRGNSGGNSQYAQEIATALVGEQAVRAAQPAPAACNGTYWRVSKGNAAALAQIRRGPARRPRRGMEAAGGCAGGRSGRGPALLPRSAGMRPGSGPRGPETARPGPTDVQSQAGHRH